MAKKRKHTGFGGHIASLRNARGFTQEVLAERSGLSADTIRRIELNSKSPNINTLRRLAAGLDMQLSTLFDAYELNTRNLTHELIDLLGGRSDEDVDLITRIAKAVLDELDAREKRRDAQMAE